MTDANGKKLSLDNLDDETKGYIAELRKEKKASDLRLKELSVQFEQFQRADAERSQAEISAKAKAEADLRASNASKETEIVDVRKLSKEEYRAYKAKVQNEMMLIARKNREARFIEALPKTTPENGKEPEPLDVRGLTKEEYRKVKEAFRRGMKVR